MLAFIYGFPPVLDRQSQQSRSYSSKWISLRCAVTHDLFGKLTFKWRHISAGERQSVQRGVGDKKRADVITKLAKYRIDKHDIVTARGLIIVDENGKTRVRIGALLPEPIIMGKRQKSGGSIAEILLYDARGNERGGYVTDNSGGNAFLTLDSNVGQEVTLVAYPNGGAEFGINDDLLKDKVVLSAVKSGPLIRLYRAGATTFQQPQAPNSK